MASFAVSNSPDIQDISKRRLILGAIVTLVLSLSIHAIILQAFHVPVPEQAVKAWIPYKLATDFAFGYALVTLFRAFATGHEHAWSLKAFGLCLLVVLGLNETLRGWVMNAYCSSPFVSSAIFLGLMSAASALYYVLAVGIVSVGDVKDAASFESIAIAFVTGAALFLFSPQLVSGVQTIFSDIFQSLEPQGGWCKLPYGLGVLIPAYGTFIEPVIAALICAALIGRLLTGRTFWRLAKFIVVILALKGQLFAAPLYAAFHHNEFLTSLLSMGQFTLEAIVLSVGAFFTWSLASRRTSVAH